VVRVYISSVIDASAESVWDVIRDFNALSRWHPGISDSRIENSQAADKVGCIREIRLRDGARIREQLLTLSDFDYQCTYSILESPLPISNYIATLKLTPVTDGNRAFAEWSAEFDCDEAQQRELAENIGQGVFQAGFNALKQRFSRK
jgi:uncharacterized protein YndB with AHSA1/START domain